MKMKYMVRLLFLWCCSVGFAELPRFITCDVKLDGGDSHTFQFKKHSLRSPDFTYLGWADPAVVNTGPERVSVTPSSL